MDQSFPIPSSTVPSNRHPAEAYPGKKENSSITWGITIISSVSLLLTLLGYGVSLAVESIFGVPHQTVYSSVLDLIGLSVYALISMLLGLGDITWQPLLNHVWPASLIAIAGMFSFICFLTYLKYRQDRASTVTHPFWNYFRWPHKDDSNAKLLGKGLIGSTLFGGIVLITPFLIIAALMTGIFVISLVPMLGMQLGQNYFQKFVVGPTMCHAVRSGDAINRAWSAPKKKAVSPVSTATCVALFKDGTRIAEGRVIVSTPTTIVLFQPVSGAVRRIPVSDLTVLPIDSVQISQ